MENILIIGAAGQIGSELTLELRKIYGSEHVFATDLKQATKDITEGGPFQILDVMDDKRLIHFVIRHKITQIYHLAAVLSGNAERIPVQAWHINMDSLMNILDLAKEVEEIKRVFWPSSVAVFGPTTPQNNTSQLVIMEPHTVYGITKQAGERWVEYYNRRYKLDIRSIRYPGLISYKTEPGGGTTECFLKENTALPMLFMPDAIKATIDLMEADLSKLTVKSSYNIGGLSFTPKQLADEIKKHIPSFSISYKPDFRQAIADSWPHSIDDTIAQKDWGFSYNYTVEKMTEVMISEIRAKAK